MTNTTDASIARVASNGITLSKSDKKDKKYEAVFKDGTTVHFGHSSYELFKGSTGVGAWYHKDHGDKARRDNYHKRHGACKETNKKSANYLSCKYLW